MGGVDNGPTEKGMNGPGRRDGRPRGPVRSIRKNSVLPGPGPADPLFGKNDIGLSDVERTGPTGGGPASVT